MKPEYSNGILVDHDLKEIIPKGIEGAELQNIILEEASKLGYSVEEGKMSEKQYWPFRPFRIRLRLRYISMEKDQTRLVTEVLDPKKTYHSFLTSIDVDDIKPPISPEDESRLRNYTELSLGVLDRLKEISGLCYESDIL